LGIFVESKPESKVAKVELNELKSEPELKVEQTKNTPKQILKEEKTSVKEEKKVTPTPKETKKP
jgi:hypothetical protein